MKRIGFTLIELLTVIAIVAILAAVIFPVASRAKDAAYRGSDMSHLSELRTALQLYRTDQGGYPPVLLGKIDAYTSAPTVPPYPAANELKSYLFPRRVGSIESFRPAYDKVSNTLLTAAVWPNQDPATPSGTAGCSFQAFGPSVTVTADPTNPATNPVYYYKVSGFDVAQVENADGSIRNEIHYALFWTGFGLGRSDCLASTGGVKGDASDDPRQLGYNNPPDDTVITWDSYFRDYTNGVPERGKREIVLFLGGGAKNYDSRDVSALSWRVK